MRVAHLAGAQVAPGGSIRPGGGSLRNHEGPRTPLSTPRAWASTVLRSSAVSENSAATNRAVPAVRAMNPTRLSTVNTTDMVSTARAGEELVLRGRRARHPAR